MPSFNVTWDDIEQGTPEAERCPVARAYEREYGRQCEVYYEGWLVDGTTRYQLGQSVCIAIRTYDKWGIMQPMEVELVAR